MRCTGPAPREDANALSVPSLPHVDKLVRQLVELLHAASRSPASPPAAHDVLLDMQVDDLRCLVLRLDPHLDPVALTPREREIARLVALGHPNKTIAAQLGISHWTVGTHLRCLFAKLHVASRAALVARALDQGLLATPVPPLAHPPPAGPAGRA